MSKFTEVELAYLQTQRLGRLATVNELGIRAQFFAGSPPSRDRLQTIAQLLDEGQVKVTLAQIFPLP